MNAEHLFNLFAVWIFPGLLLMTLVFRTVRGLAAGRLT